MICILDCHYPGEPRPENPHADLEVALGRRFNADLLMSMLAMDVDAARYTVDHHRPQSVGASMALKVGGVEQSAASWVVETHCNFCDDRNVRGWTVLHGPGGEELAEAIARHWEQVVVEYGLGRRCRVRRDDSLYLSRHLRGFVLPELGNLESAKIRQALIKRGPVWHRLVNGITAAALEVL